MPTPGVIGRGLSQRTTGSWSVGATFQLAGKFGADRCGGIENTSLISLTSEERRTRLHMISDHILSMPLAQRAGHHRARVQSNTGGIAAAGSLITSLAEIGVHVVSISGMRSQLWLDRGQLPAPRVDQFGLTVGSSAWHYRIDCGGALSPIGNPDIRCELGRLHGRSNS